MDSGDMSLSNLWEIVKDREGWHAAVQGVTERHQLAINSKNKGLGRRR